MNVSQMMVSASSVASGGGGMHAKSHVFSAFEADFWWKNENSPPQRKLGAEVVK